MNNTLKAFLIIIAVVFFAISGLALNRYHADDNNVFNDHKNLRIVSLSPSLTDSLFALGLGNNVVGVTKYCIYPAEAQTRTVVGNLYDHNYELIMQLKPDIVVLNVDQEKAISQFSNLGIPTAMFDNHDIENILATFKGLGETFDKQAEAAVIIDDIERQLEQYRLITADLPKVKTMVSVGRGMGSMAVTQSYAAGPGTYVGRLLEIAGGENVYQGAAAYPILTTEALLRLNPEVIIELVPEVSFGDFTAQDVLKQWQPLQEIDAVRNNRVYVLSEGYVVLPGPKLVLLLKDILRVLHPAVETDNNA